MLNHCCSSRPLPFTPPGISPWRTSRGAPNVYAVRCFAAPRAPRPARLFDATWHAQGYETSQQVSQRQGCCCRNGSRKGSRTRLPSSRRDTHHPLAVALHGRNRLREAPAAGVVLVLPIAVEHVAKHGEKRRARGARRRERREAQQETQNRQRGNCIRSLNLCKKKRNTERVSLAMRCSRILRDPVNKALESTKQVTPRRLTTRVNRVAPPRIRTWQMALRDMWVVRDCVHQPTGITP